MHSESRSDVSHKYGGRLVLHSESRLDNRHRVRVHRLPKELEIPHRPHHVWVMNGIRHRFPVTDHTSLVRADGCTRTGILQRLQVVPITAEFVLGWVERVCRPMTGRTADSNVVRSNAVQLAGLFRPAIKPAGSGCGTFEILVAIQAICLSRPWHARSNAPFLLHPQRSKESPRGGVGRVGLQ